VAVVAPDGFVPEGAVIVLDVLALAMSAAQGVRLVVHEDCVALFLFGCLWVVHVKFTFLTIWKDALVYILFYEFS